MFASYYNHVVGDPAPHKAGMRADPASACFADARGSSRSKKTHMRMDPASGKKRQAAAVYLVDSRRLPAVYVVDSQQAAAVHEVYNQRAAAVYLVDNQSKISQNRL